MRLSKSILIAVVALASVCASGAYAQPRQVPNPHPRQPVHPPPGHPGKGPNASRIGAKGPRPVEEFMRMSPEDRERELAKLPPARRERIRERLEQYDRMPPAQKERLKRLWDLPPERQEQVRQSMRAFADQSPPRRQAMRRQLRNMQDMTPDERKAYFESPFFKNHFSSDEQEIMKNMSDILPPE